MNTPLQQAAQDLVNKISYMGASPLDWPEYTALEDTLEAEQAQAVEPVGYIRHPDKTFWLHPECAVYASLSPGLVPVYVSPTPTFTETLAAQGIKLRKEFESKPRDHVEADRNMVGERAELIDMCATAEANAFTEENRNFYKSMKDMLEADAQEIAGWKADQKENLRNQVELQEQINSLKAQQAAPYDQQALELCAECGWKAIIPGEPCLNCGRGEVMKALDAYAAERDALMADAARYQFMKSCTRAAGLNISGWHSWTCQIMRSDIKGATLDEAIDSAIKKAGIETKTDWSAA